MRRVGVLRMRKKLSINTFATYFLLLTAIWAGVWSIQLFIASNAYYSVKNDISIWENDPSQISKNRISLAKARMNTALRYFPSNALYHQMLGQLLEWEAFSISQSSEGVASQVKSGELLSLAMQKYNESLVLRPNWSGSWIGLASVKWKLGKIDDAFYRYLYEAIAVGPQDAIVHKFVAEFGLEMFSARSIHFVEIQTILKKHLDLGLQNPLSRDYILRAIENKKVSTTVCRWLKEASYAVRKHIPECVVFS